MDDLIKYTYIALIRAMTNDKKEKYLTTLYEMESGHTKFPWDFYSFINKYGKDLRWLQWVLK